MVSNMMLSKCIVLMFFGFLPTTTGTCTKIYRRSASFKDLNSYTYTNVYFCSCFYHSLTEYNHDSGKMSALQSSHVFINTGSYLDTIKQNFFSYKNIFQQIYLNDSSINLIEPGGFNGSLQRVYELYLQNNNLNNLTDSIFASLVNLKVLLLDNNKLSFISNYAFIGLSNLKVLSLKWNQLKTFGLQVKPLTQLQSLNISCNPLENASGEIFFALSQLDIQDINIVSITANTIKMMAYFSEEKNIENVPVQFDTFNVTFLQISLNKLKKLPAFVFTSTKKLTYLNVSNNLIEGISINSFAGLSQLLTLDLHNNQIKLLKIGMFRDLKAVNTIDLSNNELETITYGLFENLPFLGTLNLSFNKLRTVDFIRIGPNIWYLKLYLDNNLLTDLDGITFMDKNTGVNASHKLTQISLDSNLWSCEKLALLLFYFQSNKVSVIRGTSFSRNNINGIGCKYTSRSNDYETVTDYTNNQKKIKSDTTSEMLESSVIRQNAFSCNYIVTYLLTFGVYLILCIMIVFLFYLIKKNNILKYNLNLSRLSSQHDFS